MATVVIALGGNALLPPGAEPTVATQRQHIRAACRQIVPVVAAGYRVVLVHGNGPQVGHLLLQNEAARDVVPPLPLDVLVAQTQGQLGYLITQELEHALAAAGSPRPVTAVLTRVEVAAAAAAATKPVGPFHSAEEARRLAGRYAMVEDAGRGWRRVVQSPEPHAVREGAAIRRLLDAGCVVVSCGGGGIPLDASRAGEGVEAVVDKDLASERLATALGAEYLLLLTGVAAVSVDFGTPHQRSLGRVTAAELEEHLRRGQFPPGSMGPKVLAAIRFVRNGGKRAVIGPLTGALDALDGRAGTQVVPG